MVGVIIVAAGRGARHGAERPKQLIDLGGRTLLQASVDAFDSIHASASSSSCLPPELVADGDVLVGRTSRPCTIVAGGARRQDSVRQWLAAMPPGPDVILVHDAARPFVDAPLIDRVLDGRRRTGAAVPAMPVRDTVKRVDLGTPCGAETIPRETIWLAQTPQGFGATVLQTPMAAGARVAALPLTRRCSPSRRGQPVESCRETSAI